MLRATIGEHVELVTSLAGDLWPVLADPGQLEQVLVNLAVNARDAMPGGGTLSIDTGNITVDADTIAGGSMARKGRNVRLRVSDSGTGMTADVASTCSSRSSRPSRRALGPGSAWPRSTGFLPRPRGHPDLLRARRGTTFTITLPVTAEAAVPVAEASRIAGPPTARLSWSSRTKWRCAR